MKFSSALLTAALFFGSVSFAGHSDRLKDIQSRLNLSFCSLITDVQKFQVTGQLHRFLATTAHQEAYGFGQLVDSLYIDCPGSFDVPARTEFNSHLRGHSLIVNFDLSSLPLFEQRIAQEEQILAQLSRQNSPLTFNRPLDFLSNTPASNESFLELSTFAASVVEAHLSPELKKVLDQVVITHDGSSFIKASAALVPSFNGKNRKTLLISVGQTASVLGDHLILNAAALEVLVAAVTENGFAQIDTALVDDNAVNSTLLNFGTFLTPEVKSLLNENKVSQIRFKAHPEDSQNLFKNGVLTLGTTVEENNFVVDLLFR